MLSPLHNSASLSLQKLCFLKVRREQVLCSTLTWEQYVRDAEIRNGILIYKDNQHSCTDVAVAFAENCWRTATLHISVICFCLIGEKISGIFSSKGGKFLPRNFWKRVGQFLNHLECQITKSCYEYTCLGPIPDVCCNEKAAGGGGQAFLCMELLRWPCCIYHWLSGGKSKPGSLKSLGRQFWKFRSLGFSLNLTNQKLKGVGPGNPYIKKITLVILITGQVWESLVWGLVEMNSALVVVY